jgi:4-hydroxymandelate oxidase
LEILNLHDLERAATERLPAMTHGYYAGGANDEITVRENRAAYDRIALRYRVMVDVSRRNLSTTLLGAHVAFPVLVAPTAFQRLAHPEGELATVRATGAAGTIMIVSTLSTTPIEAIAKAATGPIWFQLYIYKDRGATEDLVRRVEAAGVTAIVVTVDAPLLGRRERDVRSRFALPPGLSVEMLTAAGLHELPRDAADSGLSAYFASLLDPALGWGDLAWLRSITKLPLLVKGVVRADDAKLALEHGASGVVVSNHGGRQLDTAPATIDVLPGIRDEVGAEALLLVDGGVRRGTDVLKALALGARAVLLGRPILWGLAHDGENGVARALEILRSELDLAMALAGAPSVGKIGRDLVYAPRA